MLKHIIFLFTFVSLSHLVFSQGCAIYNCTEYDAAKNLTQCVNQSALLSTSGYILLYSEMCPKRIYTTSHPLTIFLHSVHFWVQILVGHFLDAGGRVQSCMVVLELSEGTHAKHN